MASGTLHRRRELISLVVVVAALALAGSLFWHWRTDAEGLTVGHVPLSDLSGRVVDLRRQGDLVLLCVYSLSCPSCVQEGAVWRSLLAQGRQQGVATFVVAADADPEEIRRYVKAYALQDLPMLYDRAGKVFEGFHLRSVPAYLLLDDEGRLIYRDLSPAAPEDEDPEERAAAILAAALAAAG
jgi:peroxiredoxin